MPDPAGGTPGRAGQRRTRAEIEDDYYLPPTPTRRLMSGVGRDLEKASRQQYYRMMRRRYSGPRTRYGTRNSRTLDEKRKRAKLSKHIRVVRKSRMINGRTMSAPQLLAYAKRQFVQHNTLLSWLPTSVIHKITKAYPSVFFT